MAARSIVIVVGQVQRAATSGYWLAAERTVALQQPEWLARHCDGAEMSAQTVNLHNGY